MLFYRQGKPYSKPQLFLGENGKHWDTNLFSSRVSPVQSQIKYISYEQVLPPKDFENEKDFTYHDRLSRASRLRTD
jgi:hypothetical protein